MRMFLTSKTVPTSIPLPTWGTSVWDPATMFYKEPASDYSYCVSSMLSVYSSEWSKCPAYPTATSTITKTISTEEWPFLSNFLGAEPDLGTALSGDHTFTSTYGYSQSGCGIYKPTPSASPCCGVCTVGFPGGDFAQFVDFTSPLQVYYWPSTAAPDAASTYVDSAGFTL